jgi:hypothetical protein
MLRAIRLLSAPSRRKPARSALWAALLMLGFAVGFSSPPLESWGFARRPPPRPVTPPADTELSAALSSSPWSPVRPEAPPVDDRDLDCLDDLAETILASEFSPFWVFDSRENARSPQEPLTLFQVHTGLRRDPTAPPGFDGCEQRPARVSLIYAPIFARDGGYATSRVCGDDHPGDNAAGTIELENSGEGRLWTLRKVTFGIAEWPRRPMRFLNSKHPVIQLSAGKHHFFADTTRDGWSSPYSNWGCREGVNGEGLQAFARLEDDRAPIGFLNVGESHAHPADTFVDSLAPLGYPDESTWDVRVFCGGLRPHCSPVVAPMAQIWRQTLPIPSSGNRSP